jgi:hypothetical protein
MRTRRLIALTVVAVLALGAVGATSYRAFAHSAGSPAAQSQDCATDQSDDATEVRGAVDTDTVELQCGDQSGPDGGQDGSEVTSGPDTDDVQEGAGEQIEDGLPDLPNAAAEAPGK